MCHLLEIQWIENLWEADDLMYQYYNDPFPVIRKVCTCMYSGLRPNIEFMQRLFWELLWFWPYWKLICSHLSDEWEVCDQSKMWMIGHRDIDGIVWLWRQPLITSSSTECKVHQLAVLNCQRHKRELSPDHGDMHHMKEVTSSFDQKELRGEERCVIL